MSHTQVGRSSRLAYSRSKVAPICSCLLFYHSSLFLTRYLQHPADVKKLLRGTRLLLRIAQTDPFSSYLDHEYKEPELDHQLHLKSDEEIIEVIKERMETVYHPTSTCRMAPLSEGGVVDSELNVYGIKGLRGKQSCSPQYKIFTPDPFSL